jgi:hypothetical protein
LPLRYKVAEKTQGIGGTPQNVPSRSKVSKRLAHKATASRDAAGVRSPDKVGSTLEKIARQRVEIHV